MGIYADALAMLEETGFWQDGEGDARGGYGPNGELCLVRALAAVASSSGVAWTAIYRLEAALGLQPVRSLYQWSDSSFTTFEDVRLLLKRAEAGDFDV